MLTNRGKTNSVTAEKAIKIATPPAEGIGLTLIRRAFGLSTAPILRDTTTIIGVRIKAMIAVTNKIIIYLTVKGNSDKLCIYHYYTIFFFFYMCQSHLETFV